MGEPLAPRVTDNHCRRRRSASYPWFFPHSPHDAVLYDRFPVKVELISAIRVNPNDLRRGLGKGRHVQLARGDHGQLVTDSNGRCSANPKRMSLGDRFRRSTIHARTRPVVVQPLQITSWLTESSEWKLLGRAQSMSATLKTFDGAFHLTDVQYLAQLLHRVFCIG